MTKASLRGYCLSAGILSLAGCSSDRAPVAEGVGGSGGVISSGGAPVTGGVSGGSVGTASGAAGVVSGGVGTGGTADKAGGPGSAGGTQQAGGTQTGGLSSGGLSSAGSSAHGGATAGSASGGNAAGGIAGASTGGAGGAGKTASGAISGSSGGSSGAAGAASTTCPSNGWAPGNRKLTLTHGGVDRAYEIHVPPGYTGSAPVPLMLVIHGAHNTPGMARSWSQMDPVADANGFIIAYPAGLDCWNAGGILPGCTAADDDVGFLKAVVNDAESHACIDPKRVYATGISNGSIMAQYMGCQAADIFAAVGGVAGGVGRCSPSRPLSVFYVHGTADQTVSFSSAQPNVTGWANRDGCNSSPVETYNQGSTKCVTYQGCKAGVEVEFCTVTGMGHCWPEDTNCGPGGGRQYGVTDFKASPMMWEFFARHPLP
ncbi:MAG TPA: PHB depolymerase family esterase [Polyangiaceae bacterium]|nr:PHB depolymerase family esterase [Polyangiaceae bacterium]